MKALLLVPIALILLLSPLSAEPTSSAKQAVSQDCLLTSLGQAESADPALTALGQAEGSSTCPSAGNEDMLRALGQAETANSSAAAAAGHRARQSLSAATTERI